MTKTKNKFSISLILLSVLLIVGSIFAFTFNYKNNNIVRADTTTLNFYGSNIYFPTQSQYFGGSNDFEEEDWTIDNFNTSDVVLSGEDVWTDGVAYYFSSGGVNYIIDFSSHTFNIMNWNGFSNLYGKHIWTDGVNYYYSNSSNQYVLNVATHTWSAITWSGLSVFNGNCIWTDGIDIYYSSATKQYVLNLNNTWTTMSWTGLNSFYGYNVWTDGYDIYYSTSGYQRILTVATHTWTTMTWVGLSTPYGDRIVNFNGSTYFFSGSTHYILDSLSRSWSRYYFNNLTWIRGQDVFVHNDILYFWSGGITLSYGSNGSATPQNNIAMINFDSVYFSFLDTGTGSYNIYNKSLFFNDLVSVGCYSISDKFCPYNADVSQITSNDFVDYVSIGSTASNNDYYIPYQFNGTNYFARVNITTGGVSQVDFQKVTLSGTSSYSIATQKWNVTNYVEYTNDLDQYVRITFYLVGLDGSVVVDYFGDTNPIRDILDEENYTSLDDYLFRFKTRYYYLNTSNRDNIYYQNGYSAGYNAGSTSGYNTGYQDGADAVGQSSYNSGYSAGYNEGMLSSNNYSFLGLISAVIDAPIKAFTGLFNFELLGVNLFNTITALFTLAIIITIVKKVV